MTKFGKILVLGIMAIIFITVGFAVLGDKHQYKEYNGVSAEKVTEEMKYIKIKGCPDEAYESKDNFNLNYYLCRSYMTDGEYVYYSGVRVADSPSPPSLRKKSSTSAGPSLIEGADVDTFEIFLFEKKTSMTKQDSSYTFTRDKDYLYERGKRVEGVDPNTFVILRWLFIQDKDSVYYQGQRLEGSDPATFEFLDNEYSRDRNFVYFTDKGTVEKLKGVDGSTFEIMSNTYTKDKNAVYYKKEKLKGLDPETFRLLEAGFTGDANFLYYENKKIKGSDPDTFSFLPHPYQKDGYSAFSKDKNNVYYKGSVLKGADPETFTFIDSQFSKDSTSLYDLSKSLKPILIAEKGELISLGSNYFRDDVNVWFRDTKPELGGMIELGIVKITQADVASFNSLSLGYAKDVNGLYFGKNRISNISPETFVVIEGGFVKDSQSVYHRGVKLEGLNLDTAYIIEEKYNNNYITDDTLIFYNSTQLVGVDVETFKIYKGQTRYSEDAERVYHMGELLDGYVPGKMEFSIGCNFVKNTSYIHKTSEIIIIIPEPIKIDEETFEIIENCFIKNANYIITPKTKIIEGVDIATFTPLGGLYSKDKNNVWHDDKIIENADVETFTVRGSGYGAKDKNTCYRGEAAEVCIKESPRFAPPPPPFR